MKRIQDFCQAIPGLERVAGQANALRQLLRITRDAVPAPMRPHVLACAVRDRTLVVFTDTGAWGSQLRFIQPAILDALEQVTGHRLQQVRFKVQQADSDPATRAPDRSATQDREISDRSRAVIESAAAGISDPQLADSLRRLARKGDQDD